MNLLNWLTLLLLFCAAGVVYVFVRWSGFQSRTGEGHPGKSTEDAAASGSEEEVPTLLNEAADAAGEPSAGSLGGQLELDELFPAEPGLQRGRGPMVPIHREDAEALAGIQASGSSSAEDGETEEGRRKAYIQIFVMAADAAAFQGAELQKTMSACGLVFGDRGIFHRYADDSREKILFSLASAVRPGSFPLENLEEMETPGIVLFMGLHDHSAPLPVFDQMLDSAARMAAELGGALEDDAHSIMTRQTAEHYRERIREYVLKYPL